MVDDAPFLSGGSPVGGKPVGVILRPGKTPGGAEVAMVLRHVVKAIRARWPRVEISLRAYAD